MKPLEGVKVVELANYLAAPSCAKILADWGAEVIKVEPLEGDIYRKLGPNQRIPIFDDGNPCFDSENVNKKFAAFNLKSQAGMDAFLRLISTADVLLQTTDQGL
jgi:crotonobetainyl-CoA:carnitine CoA-transferase CaiB-like acyl-CoA transferase